MSGAEMVLQSLRQEGVETLFGYPGGAIMPVYDALHGARSWLHHVLVRHEQGAIHAAQGFARASGQVGVCIATSGPGATNLVTGLADAFIDSTPLVCITGQVNSWLLGRDAFQETDVINVTAPVTKWNIQVTRAQDIPWAIARAFYLARTGRPGPVLVDITKDAQTGRGPFQWRPCTGLRSYLPRPPVDPQALDQAAALINQATRPLVIAGQGVLLAGATEAFRAFAEKLGAPVAWTLLGLDAFPSRHPLSVGMVGMHGRYGANVLTNECDVLIAVGMRFDDRVTGDHTRYARQAKVIHLEIDPSEINRIIPAAVPVLGCARESLLGLVPRITAGRTFEPWFAEFRACDAKEEAAVIEGDLRPTDPALRMGEVVRCLAEAVDGQAVIVSDVGQHQMAAARYSWFEAPRTSITSGGLGTMGFALPAAMGACFAADGRPVVAIIGDGGFQMTLQELGTIMQTGIPLKVIILNNSFLGMVRQWQELFHGRRYSETEMANPDFLMLARAYGIPAWRVSERPALAGTIAELLATPGPGLLEVVVATEENIFPMIPAGAAVSEIRLGVNG
jgi:acetolactate synthase-1/2/3 large subunit